MRALTLACAFALRTFGALGALAFRRAFGFTAFGFAAFFLLTAFAVFWAFFFRLGLDFFALAFEDLGEAFLIFFGIPGRLEKSKDHYPRR